MKCLYMPYNKCSSCGECSLCCSKFAIDYDYVYKSDSCVYDFKCDTCKQNKCYCCLNSLVIDNQIVCIFRKEDVLL